MKKKISKPMLILLLCIFVVDMVILSVDLFMIFGTMTCDNKINEMRTNSLKLKGLYGNIFIPSNVTVYLVNGTLYSHYCYKENMNILQGLYFDDTKEIFIKTGNDSDVYLYHELLHYQFKNILNSSIKKEIEKEYKIQCEDADEYYSYLNSIIYEKKKIK